MGNWQAGHLCAPWCKCSPVVAFVRSGSGWSHNTSITTFVERLHCKGVMGIPVRRLHRLCILVTIDMEAIMSCRWIETILRASHIQGWGSTGSGYTVLVPTNPNLSPAKCPLPRDSVSHEDLRWRWLNRRTSLVRFVWETILSLPYFSAEHWLPTWASP